MNFKSFVFALVSGVTIASNAFCSPLITVESDLQQADNTTGVVTATGNVRVLYPEKKLLPLLTKLNISQKREELS